MSPLAALRKSARGVYYGWYMVAGLATVSFVSVNMAGISFGFFIRPIQADLDINEAYFGWALSLRLIGFGVTSLIIGRLLDRHGVIPAARDRG